MGSEMCIRDRSLTDAEVAALKAADATGASETTDVTEATEAADVTEAMETADVKEVADALETTTDADPTAADTAEPQDGDQDV